MYIVTFFAITLLVGPVILVRSLVLGKEEGFIDVICCAFICANVAGGAVPTMFILMLLFYPRVRVTIGDDGVVERLGGMRKSYAYSAIEEARVGASPRRRSLMCLKLLVLKENGGKAWSRFDIARDVKVQWIISGLEDHGVRVIVEAGI